MTRQTVRLIKTAGSIIAVCVPVALTYEWIDSRAMSGVGVMIGIALALPLILLEESGFDRRTRRLSFSAALLVRALTYLGSLAAVFMTTASSSVTWRARP